MIEGTPMATMVMGVSNGRKTQGIRRSIRIQPWLMKKLGYFHIFPHAKDHGTPIKNFEELRYPRFLNYQSVTILDTPAVIFELVGIYYIIIIINIIIIIILLLSISPLTI